MLILPGRDIYNLQPPSNDYSLHRSNLLHAVILKRLREKFAHSHCQRCWAQKTSTGVLKSRANLERRIMQPRGIGVGLSLRGFPLQMGIL